MMNRPDSNGVEVGPRRFMVMVVRSSVGGGGVGRKKSGGGDEWRVAWSLRRRRRLIDWDGLLANGEIVGRRMEGAYHSDV